MNTNEVFKDFMFFNNKTGLTGFQYFDGEIDTIEVCKEIQKYIYGQSIVEIREDNEGEKLSLVLSNGLILEIASNEGCGGCGNGWYYYDKVIDLGTEGNIITKIEVEQPNDSSWGTYTLFIYSRDKRILQTDFSGSDNGYYGVGITMQVVIPEEILVKLINKEEI